MFGSHRLVIRVVAVLLIAAGVLAFAACGNDDDGNDDGAPTPTGAQANGDENSDTDAANGDANGSNGGNNEGQDSASTSPIDGEVEPWEGSIGDQTAGPHPSPIESVATLREVRMGVHEGWDRIVFEFEGTQIPKANVGYVSRALACGSGDLVQLPGEAVLVVRMQSTNAHDQNYDVTVNARELEGPGQTILHATQTCDFEAQVAWHLGMKGRQPYKLTTLDSPARLVIDIEQ